MNKIKRIIHKVYKNDRVRFIVYNDNKEETVFHMKSQESQNINNYHSCLSENHMVAHKGWSYVNMKVMFKDYNFQFLQKSICTFLQQENYGLNQQTYNSYKP